MTELETTPWTARTMTTIRCETPAAEEWAARNDLERYSDGGDSEWDGPHHVHSHYHSPLVHGQEGVDNSNIDPPIPVHLRYLWGSF